MGWKPYDLQALAVLLSTMSREVHSGVDQDASWPLYFGVQTTVPKYLSKLRQTSIENSLNLRAYLKQICWIPFAGQVSSLDPDTTKQHQKYNWINGAAKSQTLTNLSGFF
jgi:hypothetical protein